MVDLDGKVVEGTKVDLAFARQVWKRVKGQWTQIDEPGTGCTLTSADAISDAASEA